ncbi:dephospho-CoA kinase-domain-containing protein [Auriculariales sp. MPI-PUGE-AT-0066]|nr:dephospho-CoA kinase-domain-containing protein [Auriculariales sp. MPI-PUGE-AT-0066]
MHPRIRRIMLWQIIKHWLHGERVCILDVPLLVEGGLWRYCGKVVVVYCPPEVQIQRLMSRDGYTEKEALARIKSQMSISRKADYADDLLDNSGNREHAKVQVVRLARQLDAEAGWFWKVNWLLPPVGVISGTICLLRRYLTIKIPSG